MNAVAILLAAGTGERLGLGVPKATVVLGGRPLVAWSLEALGAASFVRGVIVVGDPPALAPAIERVGAAARAKIVAQVEGGTTRQASCAAGLAHVAKEADVVLVHDAARPFAEPSLFDAVTKEAFLHGAALAAEPLADTLKRVEGHRVVETLAREGLWRAQTPQGARRTLLVEAHRRAHEDGVLATDDVALIERIGHAVHVVPAPSTNRKITTPEDLAWAEAHVHRGAA